MSSPQPSDLPRTEPTPESPDDAQPNSPELVGVAAGEEGNEPAASTGPPVAQPAPQAWRANPPSRLLTWVLAIALLICGGFLLQQIQLTQNLQQTVQGLTAELDAAHQAVAAHEQHLALIRSSVDDIYTRMGLLSTLVGPDSATDALPDPEGTGSEALEPLPEPSAVDEGGAFSQPLEGLGDPDGLLEGPSVLLEEPLDRYSPVF